jgi:hypothetical protein
MQYVCMHSTVCMHSIGLTLLRLSECCISIQYRVNPSQNRGLGNSTPQGVPGLGCVCGMGTQTIFIFLFFMAHGHTGKLLDVENLII